MKTAVKTLGDLHAGEHGIIEEVLESNMTEKLLEMGCLPGEEIWVEHIAPFGDPIAVRVVGYKFTLRKADAQTVLVKLTTDT